jgi:hypothetical protein
LAKASVGQEFRMIDRGPLGLSRSKSGVQFPNWPPGRSLLSSTDLSSTEISGLVGEYRTTTIRPFRPEMRSEARPSLRAPIWRKPEQYSPFVTQV